MTMVTRSGRVSKQPERFSPQERITDDYSDYSDEDYSDDDDVSSAVSYSTDEGREYVEDGFVERDDAPVDRTDDEWVPEEDASEEADDEDLEDSETFTDDEEAMKEAEELKKNYREKESIVAGGPDDDSDEEEFTDEDDSEGLIEGEEGFTDESEDEEEDSDEDEDESMDEEDEEDAELRRLLDSTVESFTDSDEDFEDAPIDPQESRKRVRKALADKDDRAYLHELGVDPSETRNLRGVPMLEGMELNEGPVDLTQ